MKKSILSLLFVLSAQTVFGHAAEVFSAAGMSHYTLQTQVLNQGHTITGRSIFVYGQALWKPADFAVDLVGTKVIDADQNDAKILELQFSDGMTLTVMNPYAIDQAALARGEINFKTADAVILKTASGKSTIFNTKAMTGSALVIQ